MPKYYFHIRTPLELDVDDIGLDCASAEDAVVHAIKAAKEIISEWVLDGHPVHNEAFEIADEEGAIVATVPFADVVRPH